MRPWPWALVIAQFDGSLRYPSDPGFSVDMLPRLATVSAVIQRKEKIVVGGKILRQQSFANSAQVEYEGLLLALEGILRFSKDDALVQGDCRTVLRQMEGRANPRKLIKEHERAQAILGKISDRVDFQHIPRQQNKLCDEICQRLIHYEQERLLKNVKRDFGSMQTDLFVAQHLGANSTIPFSSRPWFYHQLALSCRSQQDYSILCQVGEQLEMEATTVWKSSRKSSCCADELLYHAMIYQEYARTKMKRLDKLFRRKQKRMRHFMERFGAEPGDVVLGTPGECVNESVKASAVFHREQHWNPLVQQWYQKAQKHLGEDPTFWCEIGGNDELT